MDAIDSLKPPPRDFSKPLLMPICDVIKLQHGQVSACGKLEAGALRSGLKVCNCLICFQDRMECECLPGFLWYILDNRDFIDNIQTILLYAGLNHEHNACVVGFSLAVWRGSHCAFHRA